MAICRIFKMAVAAMLDFSNYKFLNVGRIMSVELCHHAKFRGDRSNRCRDIAIFGFFKMADDAILDFLKLKILKKRNG